MLIIKKKLKKNPGSSGVLGSVGYNHLISLSYKYIYLFLTMACIYFIILIK